MSLVQSHLPGAEGLGQLHVDEQTKFSDGLQSEFKLQVEESYVNLQIDQDAYHE